MAISKADREFHNNRYFELLSSAIDAERRRDILAALELAQAAIPHIDGMVQFKRKEELRETVTVDAIQLALNYAPMYFDHQGICCIEQFLKDKKRLLKHMTGAPIEAVARAKTLLQIACAVFEYLERTGEVCDSDLDIAAGARQNDWRLITEVWRSIGFVERRALPEGARIAFSTNFSRSAKGKCMNCGAVAKSTQLKLLVEQTCPGCRTRQAFVLLERV